VVERTKRFLLMRAIVDYSSGVRFIMGDAAGPAARTKNPQG
jgi:hypothetical protein